MREKDIRRGQASKVTKIINHNFDGQAREGGQSEDELFEHAMDRLRQLGYSDDVIQKALQNAESAHHILLTGDKRDRAQAAVYDFLDRYLSRDRES